MTLRWVRGHAPGKFLKLGALKLHFQHSENTFSEIDIYFLYFQNNILLLHVVINHTSTQSSYNICNQL